MSECRKNSLFRELRSLATRRNFYWCHRWLIGLNRDWHDKNCKQKFNMVIMIIIMIVRDYLLWYEKEIRPVPLHVSLQNQRNVQWLLPVNYVSINSTVDAHPEWFRQHSPQWKKLCSQAHLTGSTAYNAMCFRGLENSSTRNLRCLWMMLLRHKCNMEFNMRLVTSVCVYDFIFCAPRHDQKWSRLPRDLFWSAGTMKFPIVEYPYKLFSPFLVSLNQRMYILKWLGKIMPIQINHQQRAKMYHRS